MKRWLPYLLTALGFAGLVAGWLLYPKRDVNGVSCSVQVLYRNYVQGSGEIGNSNGPCAEGTFELYASLGLLVLGALLLVGGWMWAGSRLAPGLTARVGPQLLAGSLLFALIVVSGAGWFGWQKYDHHRQVERLKVAEAALPRLTLPEGLIDQPHKFCPTTRDQRCLHTMLSTDDAATRVVALLHGHVESRFCSKGRTPVGCFVNIRGTIAGNTAYATVGPNGINQGEPRPPGAQQVRYGNRPTNFYVYGTQVTLLLLGPDGE